MNIYDANGQGDMLLEINHEPYHAHHN